MHAPDIDHEHLVAIGDAVEHGAYQRLTYKHLPGARNCGPQTIAEVVRRAETRGKILQPQLRTGNSLSAMWGDIISRFSAGEISRIEVAEALENSTRRRNSRVPVAIQKLL
ncbi:hypothetical protein [Bradyrhizobium sp. CB3481]|uniref:hypothetical protein n=1 Tax=Bradyrhizobium sp. CB3481 TaxID=3039158 RepID=UPI0024B1FFA1|nr:hypothetical protein [Bradyrhizobium sp. CB3481]WFU18671.1 hypothetical protein QA643_10180 [Bradyrhizobium sp. CB3481]